MTEFVKGWKSPEDLPRVIRRGLCDLSSRRIRWGLCVLRFKYLAAPTRRATVTAVGTGLPNHCLHRATGSISSTLSFPHSDTVVLDRYCLKTLTEDFLNFLSSISSVCLSSSCLSCVYAFCTLCLSFISSWWLCCYSVLLIPEYLNSRTHSPRHPVTEHTAQDTKSSPYSPWTKVTQTSSNHSW